MICIVSHFVFGRRFSPTLAIDYDLRENLHLLFVFRVSFKPGVERNTRLVYTLEHTLCLTLSCFVCGSVWSEKLFITQSLCFACLSRIRGRKHMLS